MTDELKPVRCGCGGEVTIKHYWQYRYYDEAPYFYVWCQKCHIKTDGYDTEAEAITAWNRAMSGVAKSATTERTAKVEKGAYDLMRCECGMPVSSNFDYCPKCRARLEWE